MKINDEGTSNAAHWHERAMKAEARLAEVEAERDKILRLWLDDADPAECGYAADSASVECRHDWFRLSSWPEGQFRCYSCGTWQPDQPEDAVK